MKLKRGDLLAFHITILALALLIIVYPYIAPFFYKVMPVWGDPTEAITGVPSAYDGITRDVREFNYSITHFKTITFVNPSSFIVIITAYANVIYRSYYLTRFNKWEHPIKLLMIDISLNVFMILIFLIRALTIWYQTYY